MDASFMDAAETRREIVRLEARIERLAQTIERCRKIVLAAKLAAALALLFLGAAVLGSIRAEPAAAIAALAAVVGAIVLIGANRSTAEQTGEALRRAEAERSQLIGRIPLRVAPTSGEVAAVPGDRRGICRDSTG
jgi:hypothetical protein